MTATATEPTCPKCQGPMWNQKAGKFPWKPGTPIFKCKDKECATTGGVIWEPKTAPVKSPAPLNPPRTMSSRPTEELPEFLKDAAEEDAADLQKRVGIDTTAIQKDLALYQAITEYVIRDIAPIYEKAKIGMSPESAAAASATLYIQAKRNG